MGDVTISLDALAATVEWPDAEAAADARSATGAGYGRLAELREWLASTRGTFPPPTLQRARCVVLGHRPSAARDSDQPDTRLDELAATLDVGVRVVPTPTLAEALSTGLAVTDDEVEAGTDLLIVAAGPATSTALPVLVSLLTSAEPTALLPRGAGAVDTTTWIERATLVRDTRRAVVELRRDPATLLERLDDATLAATVGVVLGASSRRTPVVLDGTVAVVAGLFVADLVSRAARWWQIADTSLDPIHRRAVAELDRTPLLDLGVELGDGTAGVLAMPMLRAAVSMRPEASR